MTVLVIATSTVFVIAMVIFVIVIFVILAIVVAPLVVAAILMERQINVVDVSVFVIMTMVFNVTIIISLSSSG